MKPFKHILLKTGFIVFILVILFIYAGCKSNPTYSISFITVRGANFRVGPLKLPLEKEGEKAILSFLARGGVRSINDFVDAGAEQHYKELFKLLADEKFLYTSKFRKEGKIDEVSAALTKWFYKTIIYQLIDATKKKPLSPNPMCMTDGKYWWVFYLDSKKQEKGDFKVIELLVTAAPSKHLKHYGKIKEDKPEKKYTKHSCVDKTTKKKPETVDLPDIHEKFLKSLNKVAEVYLVSRLKDKNLGLVGKDVRIFIPDLHLLDREREKDFKYHSNNYALLLRLLRELKGFKKETTAGGTAVAIYQLGDCLDLWRAVPLYWSKKETDEEIPAIVEKMEEDRLALIKMMRSPALNIQSLLGNHDFDIHDLEKYIDSELYYYFPIKADACPVAVTLHGDIFAYERFMPEFLERFGVYYFGPYVKGHTIDLGKLRDVIIASHNKNQYKEYIQQPEPPHLGKIKLVKKSADIPASPFNVKRVGDPAVPKASLRFAKQAKTFVKMINDETGWKLRFAVIGHTHHARIVVNEIDEPKGFFALIDCGAWIQNCEGEGVEPMPSSQIGIIYNNDARIYQLKPGD